MVKRGVKLASVNFQLILGVLDRIEWFAYLDIVKVVDFFVRKC